LESERGKKRGLNELGGGGVKPLAFSQYGELGPGLEELLETIAEAGFGETAERHLINHHLAANSAQLLRLVRQRVAMAVQKAQVDVLINRLHYAEGRRDAQVSTKARRRGSSQVVWSSRISVPTAQVARPIGTGVARLGGGGCFTHALAV
jgi:hypothetical protein